MIPSCSVVFSQSLILLNDKRIPKTCGQSGASCVFFLNIPKCNHLQINCKNKINPSVTTYQLDGMVIAFVDCVKDLGFNIDGDLKFHLHK